MLLKVNFKFFVCGFLSQKLSKKKETPKLFPVFSELEIDVKRGSGYKTITPVPRRRSDPEFAKWENDVNPILYDDYEGSNRTITFGAFTEKK